MNVNKHKYGQYFTPRIVAEFMLGLADIASHSTVLEPACGEGVFLDVLKINKFYDIDAYEIDTTLGKVFSCIQYQSFVSAKISKKYDLIIGNPPYIRWKNLPHQLKEELAVNSLWKQYFNSLCDYLYIFILKSIKLLAHEGQLIFICPEYWMNTTHSNSLRNFMVANGYFEQIYHFNETPIFNKATVSTVIFKYVKSEVKRPKIQIVKYYQNKSLNANILNRIRNPATADANIERFSIPQFKKNRPWLLTNTDEIKKITTFEENCRNQTQVSSSLFSRKRAYCVVGDVCDIGNGMVSGLDKAFQLNGQNLSKTEQKYILNVIKAKDLEPFTYRYITKYIFVDNLGIDDENVFKHNCPNFYSKLIDQKEKLEKRYQYNRKIYFWQWAFLRNYNLFKLERPRIFVPCKERISNKAYFRFAFVPAGLFPTQDVTAIFPKPETKESVFYILAFLNHSKVFDWLKNKGVIKGNIVEFSERPVASIPFRKINWQNKTEVDLHNTISIYTQQYIEQKKGFILDLINQLLDTLLNYNEHRRLSTIKN